MILGLIGAGNMARALARGWGEPVLCTDGGSGRAQALAAELGGKALRSNAELAKRADLVVLCHKPAQLDAIASEVDPRAGRIVSLLGPVTLERLAAAYPNAQCIRVMPNTAVELRLGVSCLAAPAGVEAAFKQTVREIFERVGVVIEMPDSQIDIGTAIGGVAPAYLALVAEAQIEAAVRRGMAPAVAAQIVAHSLSGSAALLDHRGMDTEAVRSEVASPGGLTERGLAALERGGLRSAFDDAMRAVLAGATAARI